MSKSSIPENAQERSTSKSADSHTISAAIQLARSKGAETEAVPLGSQAGNQSGNLANGVAVKSEPASVLPVGPSGSAALGQQVPPQSSQGVPAQPQASIAPAHTHTQAHPATHVPYLEAPGNQYISQGMQQVSGAQPILSDPANVMQQHHRPAVARIPGGPQLPGVPSGSSQQVVRPAGLTHPGAQIGQAHQPQAAPQVMPQQQQNAARSAKSVSILDITRVQNYIEKCLQLYLSQKEVVTQLEQQCQIEPAFTQLVWQKLEEQNQEFFKAYYTRLKLKDQIVLFNHLLDEQMKIFGVNRLPKPAPVVSGPMMQTVGDLGGHSFSQQRLGAVPQQAASSQPQQSHAPSQSLPQHLGAAHTAPHQATSQAPASTSQAEFNSMGGLETGAVGAMDLPGEMGGGGMHGLPFSESALDLAALGGLGESLMGSHDHGLAGIPRNFSLTDLGLENHDGSLPRNISFPEFPLDLDAGGDAEMS